MRPGGQTGGTIGEFLARLLDQGYRQAANRVIEAVSAASDRAALQRALNALIADYEARGAVALRPRSTAYRAFSAEVAQMIARQAAAVRSGAPYVMESARAAAAESVPALAVWGGSPQWRAQVGAVWNTPDPEAVLAIIERTQLSAFEDAAGRFGEGVTDALRAVAVRGVVEGKSSRALAADLRRIVADVPRYQAATMLRTLQMTAYRDATAVHQQANSRIIDRVIRIAALDDRCCLGCIALHGTEVPVGERVDDHHNGRCVGIAVVRGREVNVQTGEAWLQSLPEERQARIMGPAKYAAWRAGAVSLSDFAVRRTDPVFGGMVQEASLKGLLGEAGSQQYIEIGREARR